MGEDKRDNSNMHALIVIQNAASTYLVAFLNGDADGFDKRHSSTALPDLLRAKELSVQLHRSVRLLLKGLVERCGLSIPLVRPRWFHLSYVTPPWSQNRPKKTLIW